MIQGIAHSTVVPSGQDMGQASIIVRPRVDARTEEMQRRKQAEFWGRINPDAVLIAAKGNKWASGAWNKVSDMVAFTNRQGVYCGLTELPPRCFVLPDAFGTMRNEAAMLASNEGFEWVCYVDMDVHPEPDALMKLLRWQLPLIVPYIQEPGTGRPLHGPARQPNTGLRPVKWAVLSMLLMHVNIFHSVGVQFWSDAIGADEAVHFQRLWWHGHRLMMDTDVLVPTTEPPSYPLALLRASKPEREAVFERWIEKTRQPPDRRPIDPNSPDVINGHYFPRDWIQNLQERSQPPRTNQGDDLQTVQTDGK